MIILFDAVVAFLCCVGIIATFYSLFLPRGNENTYIAGVIVSENRDDIMRNIAAINPVISEIIVVTESDLSGVVPPDVKVVKPEEFCQYVTRANKN